MSLLRVIRVDAGMMNAPVETSQGFLKLSGFASRVGIFEYMNGDGSLRRELRLPEEVFHPDSLASYEGAPFTIGHPGTVTSRNAKRYTSGFVMKPATKASDGEHVSVEILATDEAAIDAMKKKTKRELSSGYALDLEMQSGRAPQYAYPGNPRGDYDAIQRNIRVNHLALVERGRAGKSAKVHMDQMRADSAETVPMAVARSLTADSCSADRVRATGHRMATKPKQENFDAEKALEAASREIDSQKTRADELATKLDAETKRADALAGKVTGLEQQLKDAQDGEVNAERVDELEAQVTELTAERDALKVQLDAANDPEKQAERTSARVSLMETARAVIGNADGLSDMSDREIMTLVIDKRGGKVDEKHSDEHVQGQFDGLVAGFVRGSRSLAKLRAAASADVQEDGSVIVKKTARDEYIERQQNGWRKPSGNAAQKGA